MASCPVKGADSPAKRTWVSRTEASTPFPHTLTPAVLQSDSKLHHIQVLIDCGTDESFLDWDLAKRLGLSTELLPVPRETNAVDGGLLCRVTHQTIPVTIKMPNNHSPHSPFFLCSTPLNPVILGLPWLVKRNPSINWHTGKIIECSELCFPVDSQLSNLSQTVLPETTITGPIIRIRQRFPAVNTTSWKYLMRLKSQLFHLIEAMTVPQISFLAQLHLNTPSLRGYTSSENQRGRQMEDSI